MEIVNTSFVDTSNSFFRYYSDDVNKPTRFYGMFFDLKRTESFISNVQFFLLPNDVPRDNFLPPGNDPDFKTTFLRFRFQNPNPASEKQNPFKIMLPGPLYSPNGITLLFHGSDSNHILDRSINIFVER